MEQAPPLTNIKKNASDEADRVMQQVIEPFRCKLVCMMCSGKGKKEGNDSYGEYSYPCFDCNGKGERSWDELEEWFGRYFAKCNCKNAKDCTYYTDKSRSVYDMDVVVHTTCGKVAVWCNSD